MDWAQEWIDGRAHVLANCKCLYGPNTEVITFSYNSQAPSNYNAPCPRYQAIAMRFDPVTNSWTKFLHSKDTLSTNNALQQLLYETQIELAKLFSANGISVPFSGDPIQTMTLHGQAQSHAGTCSSARSDSSGSEFIATPESTSSEKAEAALGKREPAEPEAETKFEMCKSCQPETLAPEEAPYESSEVVCKEKVDPFYMEVSKVAYEEKPDPVCGVFEPPCESLEPVCEEITQPKSEPEPEAVKEKSKKKGGKKNKKEVKFEATSEPELAGEKSKKKGKSKKEKKGKYKEEGRIIIENLTKFMEALYEPEEPLPQHKPVVESDRVIEDIPKMEESDTKTEDAEVHNNPASNDDLSRIFLPLKNKRGNGKLRETPISAYSSLSEKPSVEILGAPVAQEAEEAFTLSASLPEEIQPKITTHRTQPPAGQTIVLTILHTSKIRRQTLNTMVNLAENTKAAILDAVNFCLDSNSLLVHFPGQRKVEIRYGTGRNGDIDLSTLEESKWSEYLEYLRQYTRLPELTVDVVDFHE